MQEVTTAMRDKGVNMEWIDREELRRKIKFWVQRDGEKMNTLYINYVLLYISVTPVK